MVDRKALCRDWVVMREESTGDRLVLRPADDILPPSRQPRRRLELAGSGAAMTRARGPADATMPESTGSWSFEGDRLHVALPEWQGNYDIRELTDDRLVLEKL